MRFNTYHHSDGSAEFGLTYKYRKALIGEAKSLQRPLHQHRSGPIILRILVSQGVYKWIIGEIAVSTASNTKQSLYLYEVLHRFTDLPDARYHYGLNYSSFAATPLKVA